MQAESEQLHRQKHRQMSRNEQSAKSKKVAFKVLEWLLKVVSVSWWSLGAKKQVEMAS